MKPDEFVEEIRRGGFPAICGFHFTAEQVREIRDLLVERKRNIDRYFVVNVKCKINKKTDDWDELTTKY